LAVAIQWVNRQARSTDHTRRISPLSRADAWLELTVGAPFLATENTEERTGDSTGERCNIPPWKTLGFINLNFLGVLGG